MTHFANTRRNALKVWKTRSKRVFKVTDNISGTLECEWQNSAEENGYNHISIFCSLGLFGSHLTDILRDYRYDKYEFDQSTEINEMLYRYYSRFLLIASEILTDFQDLYILANNKFTTRQLRGLGTSLKQYQDEARKNLSKNSDAMSKVLDFINKTCKHKTANFHICNNHIEFLFRDFHKNIDSKKHKIEFGNINNYTSYDAKTFKKYGKAEFLVIPSLEYIIEVILEGYLELSNLFKSDGDKFNFICDHFENKLYG